jgi:chromosome segregation ATPase
VSVNPIQQDGNAVDRIRSRFEAVKETTVEQRALVEQLETVLEILDKPSSTPLAQRAHHPSARSRGRRGGKAKQDKLQTALGQLVVEQQQRQQAEQELAATQEIVQQLIELVSRRDKQLVSARHAWDLLKSRSSQATEELSSRVSELEQKIDTLTIDRRELETQLAEVQRHGECRDSEQFATLQRICLADETAAKLKQELLETRATLSAQTADHAELETELRRVARDHRATLESAREREAILAQQLNEVQTLLSRAQQSRWYFDETWQTTQQDLAESHHQIEVLKQAYLDREAQYQLEKARLADGAQALKAELQQLHVERLATNGFIERLVEENDSERAAVLTRQRELEATCSTLTAIVEARTQAIGALESELQQLNAQNTSAMTARIATVAEHRRVVAELRAQNDQLQQQHSALDALKEAELAKLRSGMQRATVLLESQRRQLAEAEQRLADEQAATQSNAAAQTEQDDVVTQLLKKIDKLQAMLQREAAGRRKAESRLKAPSEYGAADRLTVEDAAQKIDQLSEELAAFKKLAKTIKHRGSQKMRLAREEISRLKAQIESLTAREV